MKKKYSIIIPTYNRPELLNEFLESLVIQDFNPQDFEILIIDNNSAYDVKEQLEEFKAKYPDFSFIKYIKESKSGLTHAWNRGVEESNGELLVFLDDDVTLHKDYFKILSTDFPSPIRNITGGGHVSPVFESQKPAWINKFIMPVFAEIDLGERSKFPKNKHPYGTNMLISRDVFDKVGGFSEDLYESLKDFVPGLLENDFFKRVRSKKIPVYYFHDLVVWHFIPQEKLSKKYVQERIIETAKIKKEIAKERGFFYYVYTLLKESLKWLAMIPLGLYYIFTSQWEKFSMMFKVRWWKTKVFLGLK
jgi:glycosyltransferase involved in cell wall biosynthesis